MTTQIHQVDGHCWAAVVTDDDVSWHRESGLPGYLTFTIVATAVPEQGKPALYAADEGGPVIMVEEIERAWPEITGTVKWDGCVDWSTNTECSVHGCSARDIDGVTEALRLAYRLCADWLKVDE